MNDEVSNDNANNQQQTDLLKKIYYPDTLYPDKYVFFANRRAQSMDSNESPSTIPKQITVDNETIESQRHQTVSTIFDKYQCHLQHKILFLFIYILLNLKNKLMLPEYYIL